MDARFCSETAYANHKTLSFVIEVSVNYEYYKWQIVVKFNYIKTVDLKGYVC